MRRVPWVVLSSLGVNRGPVFPHQRSAVNTTRFASYFQDSCPCLWRGCINKLVPLVPRRRGYSIMPWMENNAVSGEKGLPPQDESGSGDMKIADLFQMLCELIDSRFDQHKKKLDSLFDQQEKMLDEIMKMTRRSSQREASLEHDARQLCLAMEAEGPADAKTRERRHCSTNNVWG